METQYRYQIKFRPGENFFPWAVTVFRNGHKIGGSYRGWSDLAKSERQAHRLAKRIVRLDRKHHNVDYSVSL